jgi:hypothetical protein
MAYPFRPPGLSRHCDLPADELARQIDEYMAEHGEISIDALRARWAGRTGGPTSK